MAPDDLKKLANSIVHADSEAEMYGLIGPLTADEAQEIAQLVEMSTMGLAC